MKQIPQVLQLEWLWWAGNQLYDKNDNNIKCIELDLGHFLLENFFCMSFTFRDFVKTPLSGRCSPHKKVHMNGGREIFSQNSLLNFAYSLNGRKPFTSKIPHRYLVFCRWIFSLRNYHVKITTQATEDYQNHSTINPAPRRPTLTSSANL